MAVVRVRQHVNPLSEKYQIPIDLPDWNQVFPHPQRPLHIDIGSAKGVFAMAMAELQPEWNFLGLEIRKPLAEQSQRRKEELGLSNLHLMFCNANLSFRPLMESWGDSNPLQQISIQFPDPWFKKRHQKRRVLQPTLVNDLVDFLPQEGRIIIQSDVEELALDMVERLGEHPQLARTADHWLPESPFPAQTDRERVTLEQELPVYRAIFVKSGG